MIRIDHVWLAVEPTDMRAGGVPSGRTQDARVSNVTYASATQWGWDDILG